VRSEQTVGVLFRHSSAHAGSEGPCAYVKVVSARMMKVALSCMVLGVGCWVLSCSVV
jgi:hypothetical protein